MQSAKTFKKWDRFGSTQEILIDTNVILFVKSHLNGEKVMIAIKM